MERYAKQLDPRDLDAFAAQSGGLSGRDIKEVCEHAERRWVSPPRLVRKR